MRILISTRESNIRDNSTDRNAWGVDSIRVWGTDITDSLDALPVYEPGLTFFVPTVLERDNALLYDGALLALRILFRYICNFRKGINIVLLGTEHLESFLCHFIYPNTIKIPGIYYCLNNQKIVSSTILPLNKISERYQYAPYLSQLGIKLPSSFKSTHSLTNDWCLYKWNSFMGFSKAFDDINLNSLYFDYLKAIEKIKDVKYRKLENNKELKNEILTLREMTSRILLIDDNVRWHKFFREIFSKSNVEFDSIGENFKKLDIDVIKYEIAERIDTFNPDVILLDFRLIEDRDADCRFDYISGTQILSMLKGTFYNPGKSYGRQVLIFSATSRIENILRLKALNADGFILKEKASFYSGKDDTKAIISNMVKTLSESIVRAGFLKKLNAKFDNILCITDSYNYPIDFVESIKHTVDSIRLTSQNNKLNESVLQLIYLDIFKIFESIKNISGIILFPNDFALSVKASTFLQICSHGKSSIYQKSPDDWNCIHKFSLSPIHHKYCKEKNLNFAICAIILFRLGYTQIDDTHWNDIRIIRNTIAHGDNGQLAKRNLILNIDSLKSYILIMLDLIDMILDPTKINEIKPILS
ncbi:MAG: response regulator [Muribaculaceae bacterium]|nr:response regulator [Muribaculaceae bacterium]